jgi:penicillin amidase
MGRKMLEFNSRGRNVEVYRDDAGVPHITGERLEDALFGLGYAQGTDRGTQLLFSYSVASGRGAQDIANTPELVETDTFFRRIGLHTGVKEEAATLSPANRLLIDAFCAGVNEGLQSLGRTWPMWATDYNARVWTVESVLMIGNLLSFGGLAVSQMRNERLLIELIHAGVDDDALRELFEPRLADVDFDAIRRVRMSNSLSDEALELLTDLPRLAGSNAWAITPEHSATGSAILAADPHLEVNRLPAIWYEASLTWGDSHFALGATLPGCPLFAIARTDQVAWGVTYMRGDTIDYFIEDCRQQDEETWQYRRGDSWHDFRVRRETIERKGGDPVHVDVLENDQGTLENEPDRDGHYLSLAWTGSKPGFGAAMEAWIEMLVASSVDQAVEIAAGCVQPTLCWVIADHQGRIALQGCGRFPKRASHHLGLTPIPAWDERNHWQGWLDPTVLPRIIDPPSGIVATANEEQNEKGTWLVTQPAGDYRKVRIERMLAELDGITIEDMQRIQYDVYSVHAERILDVLLPLTPEGPLKQRLSDWDRRFTIESEDAALFMRFYLQVIVQILGAAKRGIGWRRMVYVCTRAGYSLMVLTAADRLLAKENSLWWAYRDKAELVDMAAQRVKLAGPTWAEVNYFHFSDRFFGEHRVGQFLGYSTRKYAMPGCHATPFQGHVLHTSTRESTFAPSYHFVTSFHEQGAWTNLPGGPSENRFSKLYKNDLPLWFAGEYKWLGEDSSASESASEQQT